MQVRENVGVAVDSNLSEHGFKSDDDKDEAETFDLKLESRNSVECHIDGSQREDVCLITETNLSNSSENGQIGMEETTGTILGFVINSYVTKKWIILLAH